MNFARYYGLIQESTLLSKDLRKIVPMINMKTRNVKNALSRVIQEYDRIKDNEQFSGIEYYINSTWWNIFFRNAREAFLGEGDSFNSFGNALEYVTTINNNAFKKDSEYRISDFLKYTISDIQRMISYLEI